MTKSELAQRLQSETGISHACAMDVINSFATIVASHVAQGGTVQVAGFGRFLSKPWPG